MRTIKVVGWVDIATAKQYNFLREDARASSYLLTHEVVLTPTMNVVVEEWFFYDSAGTKVTVATQTVWPFTAPSVNPRIDLISIDPAGTVVITTWVEAGSPTIPTCPTLNLPIANIYFRTTWTSIVDKENDNWVTTNYIADARTYMKVGQWWGGWWSWVGVTFVDAVFNSSITALPATTATLIDWQTVLNARSVYVKNSSTGSQKYKIYTAAVSWVNITRNYVQTLPFGSWIYCANGTIYWLTNIIVWDSTNLNVDNITVNSWWVVIVNWAYASEDKTFNGIETTYTLSFDPVDANSVLVLVDWELPRLLGSWYDYTVTWKIVTLTYTPTSWTIMQFKYLKAATVDQRNNLYWFKTITWTLTAWTTTVISDVDILVGSPFNVYFDASNLPTWNVTWVATAWIITLISTATEVAWKPYTIVLYASQTQNFYNPWFIVSDTAYGSWWNGDTTNAPSKNAVYDKIETMMPWWAWATLFVSTPQIVTASTVYTITHNLGVTQANVEDWKYEIKMTRKDWLPSWFSATMGNRSADGITQENRRTTTSPVSVSVIARQSNTLKIFAPQTGTNARVIIKQNR